MSFEEWLFEFKGMHIQDFLESNALVQDSLQKQFIVFNNSRAYKK